MTIVQMYISLRQVASVYEIEYEIARYLAQKRPTCDLKIRRPWSVVPRQHARDLTKTIQARSVHLADPPVAVFQHNGVDSTHRVEMGQQAIAHNLGSGKKLECPYERAYAMQGFKLFCVIFFAC